MKTKIILILFLISFAGLYAQQKAKLQKVDESGFIEVDKTPELISKLNPEYPKLAKLAGIEGTVYLKLLIDEKGNVVNAKIEQGVKDMLDESALKAAKKAKFSPAMVKDKPIKVWVVLPVAFKLSFNENEPKIISPGIKAPSNISGEDPDPGEFRQVEKMPELIESVKPEYPQIAKRAGIEGKVFVKVLIDKEGNPKKSFVIKSESELFNQSAVNAAMKSKFSPAMDKGNPIAVWVVLPYKFALDGGKEEDLNKGSAKQFDTVEKAKSYFNGYTYMYGNKENREAIGAPKDVKFEKIDGEISFGDESKLYKVTNENKIKYAFIAREGLLVYHYWAQTLEEIQKYVDELMGKEENSKYKSFVYMEVFADDQKDNSYPPEAVENKLEGDVVVRVFFDESTNQFQKAEIVKSAHEIFNNAAVDFIKKRLQSLLEFQAKALKEGKTKMTEEQKFVSGSLVTIGFKLKDELKEY